MRSRAEFAAAVVLDVLAAGVALLVSTRQWQQALLRRPRPLADETLHLTGRSLDATPAALAVVALAGAVAVIATRGWARRVVGAVLTIAGAALVWRSLLLCAPVSVARARAVHGAIGSDVLLPGSHVRAVAGWPWASACCGLLIAAAGLAAVVRGPAWQAMSARYDAPGAAPPQPATTPGGGPLGRDAPDAAARRARADAALWRALDQGVDPTAAAGDAGGAAGAPPDTQPGAGGTGRAD